MDLVLCCSLIIILDLGVLCDQCYQMNLIEILASTQIQDKDFVYAMDEKFVLIEFININN